MRAAWIAVASAEHVAHGRRGGFMQVCHGKAAPLRRIRPGDGVAYYSPVRVFGGREPCRAFTAIGIVAPGEPYQVEMAPGFTPWRRDIAWMPAAEVPIAPLLPRLLLTAGRPNWAAPFRFGLVAIDPADFSAIAAAMGTDLPAAA